METRPTTPVKLEQTNQPIQLVRPPEPHIENPANWMQYGNSQAEIIMATAVLISPISGLLQVLIPVILRQPQKKTR